MPLEKNRLPLFRRMLSRPPLLLDHFLVILLLQGLRQ